MCDMPVEREEETPREREREKKIHNGLIGGGI
jgi:hypothetical protein